MITMASKTLSYGAAQNSLTVRAAYASVMNELARQAISHATRGMGQR